MLEKIGKYKIVEKIGRGAMGEVFKAHDPVLNRDVAIKTISTDVAPDSSLRKRFEREAQSAAQLSHPNIITVYEFGQQDELMYMAMELLHGSDLKQAIRRRVIRTLEQKIAVMEQICDGLELAHSQNIVHRDLKPANIHVQPDGQIKIMDFGLARLSGSEMTRTGMVMGTPNYMAPEQVRGEKADTRSDVFSIGCCFYELLCGRKPFDADSMHAVLFKVMQEAPVSLREKVRDLPVVLVQVVERCLAKDPDLRFQDAGELKAAVRTARQAIESGNGFRPLEGLQLPSPEALGAPAGAEPTGPGSTVGSFTPSSVWSGSGSGSGSGSLAPQPSRRPLYVAAGLVVVALVAAVLVVLRQTGPSEGSETGRAPAVDNLTRALVGNQVEIARKRLAAGEYQQALQQAERALNLDPEDEEANAIFKQAEGILTRVEAALGKAESDPTGALWELVQADPDHARAAALASANEARFEGRVAEARQAATTAREAARQAGATSAPAFKQGEDLFAAAAADQSAGRHATAALKLMKARTRFVRAGAEQR
jgi:serine/threonine protein kinase